MNIDSPPLALHGARLRHRLVPWITMRDGCRREAERTRGWLVTLQLAARPAPTVTAMPAGPLDSLEEEMEDTIPTWGSSPLEAQPIRLPRERNFCSSFQTFSCDARVPRVRGAD